jgi:hypothetical protein
MQTGPVQLIGNLTNLRWSKKDSIELTWDMEEKLPKPVSKSINQTKPH